MSDDDTQKAAEDQKKLAELESQLKKATPTPKPSKGSSTAKAKVEKPSPLRAPIRKQKKQSSNAFLWTVTVVNFLLVCALVAGGYWLWQNWLVSQSETSSRLVQEIEQLKSQNAEYQLNSAELSRQNSSLKEQVDSVTNDLEQTTAQAVVNNQRLNDVSGRRPSDWLLAEADYLVAMAGRKLWLERDVRTAVLMLESADSRLQDTQDPSLLPVRQLIANDIQSLQQINDVSLSSVALALSAMSNQVTELPLALPKLPEIRQQQNEISDSVSDGWANIKKQWDFFVDGLIKYQPRSTPIRPMLDAQQQWLAREQLRLALMQAQSAALAENPNLYLQSLQRGIEILVSHFDLQVTSVEKFADSLQNLSQTKVERTFPAQLESAQPLKDILNSRVSGVFNNQSKDQVQGQSL